MVIFRLVWFSSDLFKKLWRVFIRLFTMSCFLTLWFKDRFSLEDDVKKYNTEVELQAILELI